MSLLHEDPLSLLSQQTKLKEIAKWDRLAETWSLSAPPAVPSKEEIQIFQKCLLKYKTTEEFRVVILGSTKELRKIFVTNQDMSSAIVYCVDWSKRMYISNTEIGQITNPNEHFLCEDWQKFDLAGDYADVIIGDKSIDNVPYPLWERLFEHLNSILRPGGSIVLHLGLTTDQFAGISFEGSLYKWAFEVDSGKVDLETAASGVWEDCLTGSAYIVGSDPHICSLSKYASQMNELKAKLPTITNKTVISLFQKLEYFFGSSFTDEWTAYTLVEVQEALSPLFKLKEIYYSQDYEASPSSPIIELIKSMV